MRKDESASLSSLLKDLVESALIGGLLQQLGHVSVGVGFWLLGR